jgi:hypothetical protein
MDELRRPCAHRGTQDVMKTALPVASGSIEFCICRECRRFWLERNGWLLSHRETAQIMRDWPVDGPIGTLAR